MQYCFRPNAVICQFKKGINLILKGQSAKKCNFGQLLKVYLFYSRKGLSVLTTTPLQQKTFIPYYTYNCNFKINKIAL